MNMKPTLKNWTTNLLMRHLICLKKMSKQNQSWNFNLIAATVVQFTLNYSKIDWLFNQVSRECFPKQPWMKLVALAILCTKAGMLDVPMNSQWGWAGKMVFAEDPVRLRTIPNSIIKDLVSNWKRSNLLFSLLLKWLRMPRSKDLMLLDRICWIWWKTLRGNTSLIKVLSGSL